MITTLVKLSTIPYILFGLSIVGFALFVFGASVVIIIGSIFEGIGKKIKSISNRSD